MNLTPREGLSAHPDIHPLGTSLEERLEIHKLIEDLFGNLGSKEED